MLRLPIFIAGLEAELVELRQKVDLVTTSIRAREETHLQCLLDIPSRV
jgi:hypothetical protein